MSAMKRFIIRYGVFVVLAIMFVGILFITLGLEIQDKRAVSVFVTKGECQVYVDGGLQLYGDTLRLEQTRASELVFTIDSAKPEKSGTVIFVSYIHGGDSLMARLGGDTYSPGYVVAGRKRLLETLVRQIK